MSKSWAHRHAELSPNAVAVLNALTVLGMADVVVADVAAALDTEVSEIEAAVEELRQAGWLAARPASGGDMLVDGARIWLTFDAPEQPKPAEAATIAGRFLATQVAELDFSQDDQDQVVSWVSEHKDSVITAIRAGVRAGLHSESADAAAAAWAVAGQVSDPAWWRELARHGEEAATQGRDRPTLINLLNASATVFDAAGDHPTAEEQWVRVAKLSYELEDHTRIVASLTTLIEFYRRWNRRGPAVDALLELADAQRAAGDTIGRANALAELGYIMLAAGRPSTADTYLQAADDILTHLPPDSVQPVMYARVLEQRGRALWQLNHSILARRCFTRALELLADHDPAATLRVRGLLDTHADSPTLPDE